MLVLALFASSRLLELLSIESRFKFLGLEVSYGIIWAGVLFLAITGLVVLFTFGFETRVKGVDNRTHQFIDLLVDTQGELLKVSWPTKDELSKSTVVVILCIVIIGLFLFIVDQIVVFVMTNLRVLPK